MPSFDFTGGSLPSGVSVTRASTATLFDSTGKLIFAPNNLIFPSQDQSGWTKNNATISGPTVSDPFGGNTACTFTAPVGNGEIYTSIANTYPNTISSIWMRRRTGSGVVNIRGANNGGWISVPVTSTWTRFDNASGGTATGAAALIDLQIITSGDAIDICGAQIEAVTYETAPRAYNQTVAAPYHGPRFDYNPSTLALRGLLIEAGSTNLCLQSKAFDATYWATGSVTKTANAATFPDGTTTMCKLAANTGVAGHRIESGNIATVPGKTYTVSAFFQPAGFTFVAFHLYDAVGPGFHGYLFSLTTGLITQTYGTPSSYTVQNCGGGIYRFSVTKLFTGTTTSLEIWPSDNGTDYNATTGNGVNGIYGGGGQCEFGSSPSSFFPTTAAMAARADEALVLNWTGQSVPDGACFSRITYDDLSTSIVPGTIASGVQTIAATSLARATVRRIDYMLAPTPTPNRRVTLIDNA